MTAQILFVVWRESIEALLVIGILHAWLRQNGTPRARFFLWGGVAAGLAAAAALAWGLSRLGEILPPDAEEIFQAALVFLAAALVVQMVVWMRRHGRNLKRDLQVGLSVRLARGQLWGIFGLALIAVMREGSEAVIFLQGILAAVGWTRDVMVAVAEAFFAAAASYVVLQLMGRALSWRVFFGVTEVLLLLLAAALTVSGAEHLVSLGLLPYTDLVWDSRWLLDDSTAFGGTIAGLTGYRAAPDAVTLATWILYWGGIAVALRRPRKGGVSHA